MELQETVDKLVKAMRVEIISFLVKEDTFKYKGDKMNDEDFEMFVDYVYKMDVPTRNLRRLFADAHEMHDEKGMMPHCVTIGDLEWCVKKYGENYINDCGKYPWMPEFKDNDLKNLQSFIALDALYRKEKRAIPPTKKEPIKIPNILMEAPKWLV